MKGYYFITDSGLSIHGNLFDVRTALNAGVQVVQYRNKDASTRVMYEEGLVIRGLCRTALFIVNDRIDVALAVHADGVHVGQDDMPYHEARRLLGDERIIGVTVHTLDEALDAERAGADYVGVSPIFATGTKRDAGAPCGTDLVRKIRAKLRIPIVAIGGITHANAREVIDAGSDAVCAISAVVASDDPVRQIIKFQEMFR